jgi:hypothetical protein
MQMTGGSVSPPETCDERSEATGGMCAPEACKIGFIREGEVCVIDVGQYSLRHLSAGEYTLLIYPDPSEETDELSPTTSPYNAPPLARFNFEIGASMLNDAILRDWLIKWIK